MNVEDFCRELVNIIFEKDCRVKEAAMEAIINCNLTWEEFVALFPENKLVNEKEFREYKKQKGA